MLTLSKGEIIWIYDLIKKTGDLSKPENQKKIYGLAEKVLSLNYEFEISVTAKDINDAMDVISQLEVIGQSYRETRDICDVEAFDTMKKEMGGLLQTLLTYKENFLDQKDVMEDYLKKVMIPELAFEFANGAVAIGGKTVSYTQAEKLVHKDTRYKKFKEDTQKIARVANLVKAKYLFFNELWGKIFQSVSTASKEKYASRVSNNT